MRDVRHTTTAPPAAVAADGTGSAARGSLRYRAFISYSHDDARWAAWVHRALEGYRVPKRLRGSSGEFGPLPDRMSPIFRDREELASAGELGPRIQAALADSEAMIVVCSPAAVRSPWVNEEILAFKRLGRSNRIYSLIVAGEPHADGDRECFPPALRFDLDAEGNSGTHSTEPLAADVRIGKDGKSLARLKLLSGLLGVDLYRLRQRETQRRQRRLLAITALALVVMLVTSVLAVQAVVARGAAERRQKQAENLVNFMLGDLNDKLAEVQRLDILEAVDDHAMAYFQSLPITDVTDESLQQRAKALVKIGSVRLDQGRLPQARESYQAALTIAATLATAAPTDTARQLAHAEILAFIGTTHWYQGELDAAQRSFEAAQDVLQRARRHAPEHPQLLFQQATVANNVGHVLEARGRLDEATVHYQAMLMSMRQLVALQPEHHEWSVSLGIAHNNLAKLALMQGDLAAAVVQYAADDAIQTRLAARNPKDNNQVEKVAITRATLGRTLALAGEVEVGIRDLQRAVELSTRLQTLDPSNTSFQENVALYGTQLSRLQRLRGELPAAVALTMQSLSIFLALTTQEPAHGGWQREFAEARLEQVEQSQAEGQIEDARAQAQVVLAMLDPMLAQQPDDRATLLAAVRAKLLFASLSDATQTAASQRAAALSLARSAKSGHDDPRLLALQVEALLALGRKSDARPMIEQLRLSGYRDLALLALLEREGIDYPAHPAIQQALHAAIRQRDPP